MRRGPVSQAPEPDARGIYCAIGIAFPLQPDAPGAAVGTPGPCNAPYRVTRRRIVGLPTARLLPVRPQGIALRYTAAITAAIQAITAAAIAVRPEGCGNGRTGEAPGIGAVKSIWKRKEKGTMEKYGVAPGRILYENPLSCEEDLADFCMEGSAILSFPRGRLRLENRMDAGEGQKANYVLWCPEEFPADVLIEWDFLPIREPGLCILFFAASGRNGEDLFSEGLAKRSGEYVQYHHGDINAFHVSYFRRKEPDERAFHTCNLRKSYGFHLVAQGGDPIPDAAEAVSPYRMAVLKKGREVAFFCNGLEIFRFVDDGTTFGEPLAGGKIGFRQLAPLIAEYGDLKVYEVTGAR